MNSCPKKTLPPADVREWWKCEFAVPRPDELLAFAALHDPAAIWLQTTEEIDRVGEAYIAASREAGHWLHMPMRDGGLVPFHADGERGYRDRLKDYKAALAWSLRQRRAK